MPILRIVLAAFFCKVGVKFSLRQPCFLSNNNKKMEYDDISVQFIKRALIYANLKGRYANKNQQQEKTNGSYLLLWTIRNLIKLAALLLTLGRKVFLYLFLKKGKQRVSYIFCKKSVLKNSKSYRQSGIYPLLSYKGKSMRI